MAKYKLLLPKMGESVAEATVIRWTKSPGDYIEADETVMEIATDKVDSDVPSPVSGRLVEQLYKENDVVQVGAVIAIIETAEPEAVVAPPAPVPAPVEKTPEPVVVAPPPVAEVGPRFSEVAPPPPVYVAPVPEIKVPEATPPPPPIYEAPAIELKKPEVALPSFIYESSIPEIKKPEVAPPPVVEAPPVSEIKEPEVALPAVEAPPVPEIKAPAESIQPVFAEQREELAAPVPYTGQLEAKETPKAEEAPKTELRFYSPLVKNIAAQEGIDSDELDRIPGSGAEGRLTKDDLLAYIENKQLVSVQAEAAPVAEEPESTAPEIEAAAETPSEINAEPAETEAVEVPDSGPVVETLPEETPEPVAETAEPETVSEEPQPEPVVETAEPEPVVEEVKSEPIVETPEPEPVVEEAKPDPIVGTPQPEPVVEKPQPEPVYEAPKAEPIKPSYAETTAKPAVSMSGGDELIEMDRMGRLIADHMVMSKHTSAHVTSFVEADVTNLVLWREKIKGAFEKREGERITFTPIFIEAVVRAIKDMPMINVQVNGTQIIKKKDINISMATALPNGNLIVPVIKRADELSLIGLTKAVNDLANRARISKLKPDDIQGGTFTLTNVGTFGNVMGTPIINQPQVAILAVGAIRKKPAVIETLQGDMIGIRHMMFLSLSYDHRVVNGALGGSFVRRVADYLENWDPGREI